MFRGGDSPHNSNDLDEKFERSDKNTHQNEHNKSDDADHGHTKGTDSSIKVEVNPNAPNK